MVLFTHEEEVCRQIEEAEADLVICPFLKDRVPQQLWSNAKRPVVIIHPGIVGDRGASALDWAISKQAMEEYAKLIAATEKTPLDGFSQTDLKGIKEGKASVGMTKVFESGELAESVELALSYGGAALAERCIIGGEYTVGVLQSEALPSIRIETPRVFYDYRAKYESDRTEYHCPGTADAATEAIYAGLALAAFNEIGCSGWGRVDFMTGEDGQPLVLEVNTIPGMTSHSLVPMAARQAGIDFGELCWRILETSVSEAVGSNPIEVAANDA